MHSKGNTRQITELQTCQQEQGTTTWVGGRRGVTAREQQGNSDAGAVVPHFGQESIKGEDERAHWCKEQGVGSIYRQTYQLSFECISNLQTQ